MSMSMHVEGFGEATEEWQRKAQAFSACEAAGIEPPQELWSYFGDEAPDIGKRIPIPHADWRNDSCQGFEVRLAEIPPGVKVLRFYCAW